MPSTSPTLLWAYSNTWPSWRASWTCIPLKTVWPTTKSSGRRSQGIPTWRGTALTRTLLMLIFRILKPHLQPQSPQREAHVWALRSAATSTLANARPPAHTADSTNAATATNPIAASPLIQRSGRNLPTNQPYQKTLQARGGKGSRPSPARPLPQGTAYLKSLHHPLLYCFNTNQCQAFPRIVVTTPRQSLSSRSVRLTNPWSRYWSQRPPH